LIKVEGEKNHVEYGAHEAVGSGVTGAPDVTGAKPPRNPTPKPPHPAASPTRLTEAPRLP
jgi:hypothetical protein